MSVFSVYFSKLCVGFETEGKVRVLSMSLLRCDVNKLNNERVITTPALPWADPGNARVGWDLASKDPQNLGR